jgi:transcription elongation GreA/GreB family factor
MKRQKLKKLLDVVNAEISKAEVHYEENKVAAEKMSETARASWSSAGDREYAMDQEEVTKLNLDMLKALSRELGEAVNDKSPGGVKPPCFVRVHIDGEDVEFYLVENVASVKGFKIVSIKSPVGEKIIGKKKYDTYNTSGNSGKIIGIE